MGTFLAIFFGFMALLALFMVGMYNNMVRKRNNVENAFGGIDAQLKKRFDLIPNLVNTVKEFMGHEKDLLEGITELRTKAMNAQGDSAERAGIESQISSAMGKLMVAVENYPDLKSNQNFLNLQRSLNEVESQLSAARRTYNAAVTAYNNSVETFPNNLIAGAFNFGRKAVFDIPEVERGNVDVGGLFNA